MISHSFRVLLLALLWACGGQRAAPRPPFAVPNQTFFTAPDTSIVEPKSLELEGAETIEPPSPTAAVPQMRVHLIDVGQGAATLIEFSCAAILIDTGGESNDAFDSTERLDAYLKAFFESRPDLKRTLALLLLTHPHIDHARGAKSVWANYKVQNVVTDGLTNGSGGPQQRTLINSAKQAKIGVSDVRASLIRSGGFTDGTIDPVNCPDGDPDIRVLWGQVARSSVNWNNEDFDDGNNHSVVVKITLGGASIIVTGDLEKQGISELLARHKEADALDADVYQVGHHGSSNATTAELLDAITPRLALIGAGSPDREKMWTAWAHGHPHRSTIELLAAKLSGKPRPPTSQPLGIKSKTFSTQKVTAPIFATGWDGHVRLTMYADGRIGVRTERAY